MASNRSKSDRNEKTCTYFGITWKSIIMGKSKSMVMESFFFFINCRKKSELMKWRNQTQNRKEKFQRLKAKIIV